MVLPLITDGLLAITLYTYKYNIYIYIYIYRIYLSIPIKKENPSNNRLEHCLTGKRGDKDSLTNEVLFICDYTPDLSFPYQYCSVSYATILIYFLNCSEFHA